MRKLLHIPWRTSYIYLFAVLFVLAMAGLYVYYQASVQYREQVETGLARQAERVAEQLVAREAWQADPAQMAAVLGQLEGETGAKLHVYAADGALLAHAGHEDEDAAEQVQGPEVRAALSGETGVSRRGASSGQELYYVGAPVHDGDSVAGAIQFAFPVELADAYLVRLRNLLQIAFAFSAVAIGAILLWQARRTSHKLELLTTMVERITKGDLDARVLTFHRGEFGRLATSMNNMADRLQSQIRKRRREKDRLNTVLRTMTDGIVILTRRGVVRTMNPAASRILDVPLPKARHRSIVQVARDFRIAAVWARCLQTGAEQSATIELANDIAVRVVITPFLKHRARGYLVLLQDLTQLRHLQTVRQDFVSNVSHELRTPLASLRALVETLRDGALDDPPAAARFLDRMEVEVDALTHMVQELMELSRIESGQVPLDRRPVLAQDLVLPAVERLRPQAERAGLELTVEIASDLPKVDADSERIQQVMTNLVHNAIKFTPSGGAVDVRAGQAGDMLHIIVRDSGIGIAPEELERVFERFYKADRSRGFGGTGLGLSIASHLVQAHGGAIWVNSVEGEWSEFGFSLPLAGAGPGPQESSGVRAVGEPNSQVAHEPS